MAVTNVEFCIALYLANCVVHAMPEPSGHNEWYLFIYRLLHLLLLNIKNVVATAKSGAVFEMQEVSKLTKASGESQIDSIRTTQTVTPTS